MPRLIRRQFLDGGEPVLELVIVIGTRTGHP